ncbi:MAG: phospholipase D family protein [Comamonas sp.]
MAPASIVQCLLSRRRSAGLLALLGALLLGGCASRLPTQVERPVSTAVQPSAQGTLGQIVASRKQRESRAGPEASGFALLTGPQSAYGSRLALVEAAQQTLDLQYYAIHADASTERLLLGIVDAARRGVRVRVLLDDFHSTGRNAQVMRLAFVPNIEMRMFNPLVGSRASTLGRIWGAATDFQRAQQRMHNKLFVADNLVAVMGGRNLGDAYFGTAESSNFLDADLLAAGPIVQDLSRSFDSYWNNPRAYPVQSLIAREELEALRQSSAARDAGQGGPRSSSRPTLPDGEPRPGSPQPSAEQRLRAWDMRAADLRTMPLVWARSVMLADEPSKIPTVDSDGLTDPLSASKGTLASAQLAGINTPRGAPPPAAASGADSVVEGLIHLIGYAKKDLLIVSPYFVPGSDMMAAFRAARERGVRIRVLTNSLSSNDAPVAHVGYARYREALLNSGVELYELVSDSSTLRAALGVGSGSTAAASSRLMLHSKLLVMDGQILVVGSMNLDQRSQLQNTEIAVLVRSRKLSAQTAAQIEKGLTLGAWRVVLEDGALRWKAPPESDETDQSTEPDTSLPLRLLLRLIGPFAPDELL